MLIGQVCLDSSSKAKAVTGTDMAMCLGIILGNGVWEIDCKNGCNSLPLPVAVPFAMFLLSKVGVYFPTLKSGLAFWFALTNWIRWKWVYVSFKPRSWEAWALMLYLLRQCYVHKWKDVRSYEARVKHPKWVHPRPFRAQLTYHLTVTHAWASPAEINPAWRRP